STTAHSPSPPGRTRRGGPRPPRTEATTRAPHRQHAAEARVRHERVELAEAARAGAPRRARRHAARRRPHRCHASAPLGTPRRPGGRASDTLARLMATVAPHVFAVSELVNRAHRCVEQQFPPLWVEGEITNLRLVGSGHAYFTLRDSHAILPVAMWRSALARLRHRLADGQTFRIYGR